MKFENYLLKTAWRGSEYLRNQFVNNLMYSLIHEKRFKQFGPVSRRPAYIDNAVRHLFGVGVGALPGFVPATNNSAAPIDDIIKVYTDIYRIKKYQPDMMHLGYFSSQNKMPVYYSLQYPTAAEFSPKSLVRSVALSELDQIKELLRVYRENILKNNLQTEHTLLYEFLKKAKFEFYHSKIRKNETTVKSTTKLFENDSRFVNNTFADQHAVFSSFLKGCIKISID